jgi:hypothetical protein
MGTGGQTEIVRPENARMKMRRDATDFVTYYVTNFPKAISPFLRGEIKSLSRIV